MEWDGNKIIQCEAHIRGIYKPILRLDVDPKITSSIVSQRLQQKPQELGYYDMTASMHGVAFIINIKKFEDTISHETRHGTERDEYNLKETFHFLGYRTVVFSDLTSKQILCLFESLDRQVQASDDKATSPVAHDSFVCCILSHGGEGVVYGSDSKPVEIKKIEALLVNNTKFKSLPKMLFIQACQGQGHGIELPVRPDSGPAEERIDLYTCLASVPGDKSYRDINRGSWFVTELCKILCKYATCLSLQSEDFKKHLEDSITSTYKIITWRNQASGLYKNQLAFIN